jgi:hypothetical protein
MQLTPFTASYSWGIRLVLIVYSVGFLIGTFTHISHIIHHGILVHPVPLAISIYWDALTLLDPLTAIVLWWKPQLGIKLALAIMVSDISLNTYTYLAGYFGPVIPNMVPLYLFDQALFGLFVFVTAPLVQRQFKEL